MEDARDFILRTALTLFLEKSYKAVTFKELMEKTGFSKGAFFYYFKSKQEIFEAVIDIYIGQFVTVDYSKLPQDNLREFLDSYFQKTDRTRTENVGASNRYSLIFEAMRLIPDFKIKVNRHEESAVTAWTNVINSARKNREIKTVLSDLAIARLFIDAGHGVVINSIMTDKSDVIDQGVFEAWNNIYRLIKS
jgi:AcrR family transcriptional regulator